MDDQNKSVSNEKHNIENELNELKNQYNSLIKEFKMLKENDVKINKLKENMTISQQEFSQMNQTLQEITNKLNCISDENRQKKAMRNRGSMMGMMGGMMGGMLRKTAVMTIGTVMKVADVTMRTVSMAKEGIEDIVAEAQYENTKKRRNEHEYCEE